MTDRLTQLQKLYEADANDPFVTYGIALEHAKADRQQDAIDWLDRTLAIDSNYFYGYFQKAKALSALGQEDAARAVLDDGIARAWAVGGPEALHAAEEMGQLKAEIGD